MKKFSVLICGLLCVGMLSGCMEIVTPIGPEGRVEPIVTPAQTGQNTAAPTEQPTEPSSAIALTGTRLEAVEAPYAGNAVRLISINEATFMYREAEEDPSYTYHDAAEGFSPVPEDGIIRGTDGRNLVIAAVDEQGRIERYGFFRYVPGLCCAPQEGEATEETKFRITPEYQTLIQTLLNTDKTEFSYGAGQIRMNYLQPYGEAESLPEFYRGRICAGIAVHTPANAPVYSPLEGELIAVGGDETGMNRIAVYNPELDVTLEVLHCSSIAPAEVLKEEGGAVHRGDLLGYAGTAGNPVGFDQVYLELKKGRSEDFFYASDDPETVRTHTYDPRILALYSPEPVVDAQKATFSVVGTTQWNANNLGLVARDNDTIYYANFADHDYLYKMNADGTDPELVAKVAVKYLNVVEGWIYFCNISDGQRLYKIRIDGTEKTKLMPANKFKVEFVTVVDDMIYFSCFTRRNRLSHITTDGEDFVIESDGKTTAYVYYGDKLYLSNDYKYNRVFTFERIVSPDGESFKLEQLTEYRASAMTIVDDTIYFANVRQDHKLYKMNLAGEAASVERVLNTPVQNLNYADGYLYYVDMGQGGRLCRMRLDGTDRTTISEYDNCADVNIIGRWLYYTVYWSDRMQFRVDLETGERVLVAKRSNA